MYIKLYLEVGVFPSGGRREHFAHCTCCVFQCFGRCSQIDRSTRSSCAMEEFLLVTLAKAMGMRLRIKLRDKIRKLERGGEWMFPHPHRVHEGTGDWKRESEGRQVEQEDAHCVPTRSRSSASRTRAQLLLADGMGCRGWYPITACLRRRADW